MSSTITATGVESTVTFDGVNVMISPGVKGSLMMAARLSAVALRRPAMLLLELDGPKREALTRALDEEKELLAVLLRSIKADNAQLRDDPEIDPDAPRSEALLAALRSNRKSVAAAVSNHKGEIVNALRRNKAVLALLLWKFIPIGQVERVDLGDDTLHITAAGTRHSVRFERGHAEEFAALVAALRRD